MKKILFALISASMFMVASPAFAGKVNVGELIEMGEDAIKTDCAQKIGANAGDVGNAWQTMRQGCAQLRNCKKTCRQAKRGANKDVRADRRDCKSECKGKKGKAKRQCKKSCNAAAKGAKRGNRQAARNCKTECRNAYRDQACRSARQAFWKAIGKTIAKAGPACAKDAAAFFNGN
ncbi:MAG: hypothetical protein ACE366_13280 [Bradymonadia bacterium]